jgi:phospholipid/cholesterol/gamma-HCH transport system substrate-binding protein
MESRSHALIVGFFIIGFVLAIAMGFRWLQGDRIPQTTYVVVSQTAINGLNATSEVRMRGLIVGRVISFHFDPQDRKLVLIKISVNSDIPITTGTFAKTVLQGITGQSAIELNEYPGDHPKLEVAKGQTFPRIPMNPSAIENLAYFAKTLFNETSAVLAQLKKVLSDENIQLLSQTLANAKTSTDKMPVLIDNLERTSLAAQTSLSRVDSLIQNDSVAMMESIQAFSETGAQFVKNLDRESGNLMGDVRDDMIPRANQVLNDLERAVNRINGLSDELSDNPSVLVRGVKAQPGPGEPGFK